MDKHKSEYYIATWEELLKLSPNKYGDKNIALKSLDKLQVWSFCSIEDRLLLGVNGGIYEFVNNNSTKIYNNTNSIYTSYKSY